MSEVPVLSIGRVWTKEVPEEWETTLRAFSPRSRVVSWLALRWFPMRRQVAGVWMDAGRWLLSECVPDELIAERDRDIVTILQGPKPSTLPPNLREVVQSMVNDYQWTMYRDHRVWARELWVLQGSTGGHATAYTPDEQKMLQLVGRPTSPPPLGALPYAPLDGRVLDRMRERNRLHRLGSLDAVRKSGDPALLRAEEREAAKQFRKAYLSFLEVQSAGTAELIASYTRKSEHRGDIREASAAEVNAAARMKDEYIETGEIPRVAA